MENNFIILRDTREQQGWFFKDFLQKDQILIEEKLDQGDYALKGLENYCIIERKKSVDEVINNFCNKNEHERITREIEKLIKSTMNVYFILSFTVDDLRRGSRYSRVPPNFILSSMLELEMKYNVRFIFAGKSDEYIAYRILSKVWSYYVKKESRW